MTFFVFHHFLNFHQYLNHFRNQGENSKKFKHYCIYAFGLPIAIVIIVVILNEASLIPECWKTGIGKHSCSASDPIIDTSEETLANSWYTQFLYLYGPILVCLLVNSGLIASTFYTIHKRRSSRSDDQTEQLITEKEMPR
jgi:hypothetical protein